MDRASAMDLCSAAGLLNGSTSVDVLAGLLPATQGERRRGRQPIGQDREGLMARPTHPASRPNAFVAVIVGLAEPLSMADDRIVAANRTSPREEASPRGRCCFSPLAVR